MEAVSSLFVMVFATGMLIGSLLAILCLLLLDWSKETRLKKEQTQTRVKIV